MNFKPSLTKGLLGAQSAALLVFAVGTTKSRTAEDHLTVSKISLTNKEGEVVGELDGEYYGGPQLRLGPMLVHGRPTWSVIVSSSSLLGRFIRINSPTHSRPEGYIYLGLDGQPATPLFTLVDPRSKERLTLRSDFSKGGGLIMEKTSLNRQVGDPIETLWANEMRNE